jgi:hypothetical protein
VGFGFALRALLTFSAKSFVTSTPRMEESVVHRTDTTVHLRLASVHVFQHWIAFAFLALDIGHRGSLAVCWPVGCEMSELS